MHTEIRSGNQTQLDIDARRSEFRSDSTEVAFLTHHLAETQSQLRSSLIFCSVFYLAFSLSDIAILGCGRSAFMLFLCRLTVAITAGVCIWLIHLRPQSVAITRLAATVVEAVGMSTFLLVVVFRPDELPWHAMSMAIMLIVVYIFIPNRLVYSLAVALSATVTFISLVFTMGHLKPSETLTMSMLLVLTNTFGWVAARRYQRLWREEFSAQSILRNLSMQDHLTGCFNRRYLHEKLLESEISRASRYRQSLTVIMCDLDHFKGVNDSYGHQGGDAVLRVFSQTLEKMTRSHIDSVVRYGGEEFLLILPETNLHDGILLAERLRMTFAAATVCDSSHYINSTASFGVATINFAISTESITLDSLISMADEMLYEAKKAGRNQVKALQLP
jgi:diguanylate cyclase (GGDEF)-like protein